MIRRSMPGEEAAIRKVYVEAFKDDAASQKNEQEIVDQLRDDGALAISLVAVVNGTIGGHAAFSPATLNGAEGWYMVGPVGVLPECRSSVDNEGLLVLAGRNAVEFARRGAGCIAIGDLDFYGRLGFARNEGVTIAGVPDEKVLSLAFYGAKVPAGEVKIHPAYAAQA